MLRLVCALCICLLTFQVFAQAESKYQPATITDVKPHPPSTTDGSNVASYDVSLRVGDNLYMVLYTPPFDTNTVKYAAGRELLVLVGEKTIKYNDLLGQSHEAPIISRKPAAKDK